MLYPLKIVPTPHEMWHHTCEIDLSQYLHFIVSSHGLLSSKSPAFNVGRKERRCSKRRMADERVDVNDEISFTCRRRESHDKMPLLSSTSPHASRFHVDIDIYDLSTRTLVYL